jgi:hypothetical protein
VRVVPRDPVPLDEVARLFPRVRQSLLAKYDDCALSTYFELKFAQGWSTHPQARGTIFHRFAAECLREMKATKKRTIPVQLAEQILVEQCRQADVEPRDIVRVPLRQMGELRMAARKFAKDNEFSFQKIVDIEKRLTAPIAYPKPGGGFVVRELSGQLDALLWDAPDGAIVIDWKDTWALPPEPKERDPEDYIGEDDELRGISYHGYFQQRFYGWLVMKNYRNVNRVTLREFYARKTKVRKATLTRDRLPEIEEELSILIEAFDRAVAQGEPSWPVGWFDASDPVTGEVLIDEETGGPQRVLDIERLGSWKPQPGKHCGFCAAARHCPIDEDTRIEAGGAFSSWESAKRGAAELQVVDDVRAKLLRALKGFVETQGRPIPIKSSKGRRMLGWYTTKRGRRFGLYTPDASDRGGHPDLDRQLEEAMREATARALEAKPRRRHRRPGKV